jgi:RNA polymerase sigma factor (sigma-70 family)
MGFSLPRAPTSNVGAGTACSRVHSVVPGSDAQQCSAHAIGIALHQQPDETRLEMAMHPLKVTGHAKYPTTPPSIPADSGRTTTLTPRAPQARPASGPGHVAGHRKPGLSHTNHPARHTRSADGRKTPPDIAQAVDVGAGTVDPGALADKDTAHLLSLAGHGDEAAMRAIVDRFDGLLWSIVRSFRLGEAQAADAVQTTWLRLLENLRTIRDPERLPAWLKTTAQRASIDTIRSVKRERQLDLHGTDIDAPWNRDADRHHNEPEASVMRKERIAMVRRAVQELSERHQDLLGLLVATPPMSYQEIGARLGMPVGSIGPTRARLLARLRNALEAADVHGHSAL